MVGAHQCALSYIPNKDFRLAIHTHSFSTKYEAFNTYDVMPTGEGIWGLIVGKDTRVRMTQEEVETHPLWKNFSGLRDDRDLEHPPMRGWLAVPILRQTGENIGVLQISDKYEDAEFTEEDEELLARVANVVAPTFELQYVNQELQKRTEELQQKNKEIDEFAYVASHDLRSPLAGIRSLAKWVNEDSAHLLPEKSKKHLEQMQQRVLRLERLLDDLLNYSRAGRVHGEIVKVDCGVLLRETIELLPRPEGFTITLPDGMPTLVTAKTPLEQVFRNLIVNAIKHHDRDDGRVEVSSRDTGLFFEFRVADDGPGIDPEYHDQIFRLFETLRPRDQVEGSGMGLSIIQKIIERYGGTISVDSSEGSGATFCFTWPKRLRN